MESVGVTSFDVVIDDGSHRPDHQQISLGYLFQMLKPGGLYFIEDLLANGRGDGRSGRMASDEVLNTRTVLRHLRDHGSPASPHAIGDPDVLSEQMDHIGLHAPLARVRRPRLRGPWRWWRATPAWREDSERLAVLRKRADLDT